MKPGNVWRCVVVLASVGSLGLVAGGSPAEASSWRIDTGDVRILVPLKPGGAFEAKTSALSGALTPGSSRPLEVAGEIELDLTTIETGISLRDRHLRENYLEVSRGQGFDKAVLSKIVLSEGDGAGFRGKTDFSASLLLHGVTGPVAGKGEILDAASGVKVEAEFVLTLTDFGIEPPQYMGVGVSDRLVVKVSFGARPEGTR